MNRKKRDELTAIMDQAFADAARCWGRDYPLSYACHSQFGSIAIALLLGVIPAIIIGKVFEDSGYGWLEYVYIASAFALFFCFGRSCRRNIEPYLKHSLAKLDNPVCRKCKYDLRGLTNFDCCPECGTTVTWLEQSYEQS